MQSHKILLFYLLPDPLIKEIKIAYYKAPENEKANWKQDGYFILSDEILRQPETTSSLLSFLFNIYSMTVTQLPIMGKKPTTPILVGKLHSFPGISGTLLPHLPKKHKLLKIIKLGQEDSYLQWDPFSIEN